ncbi:hypothetical protein T440DRAFT_326011 [Plenodomus tracheiphilus IPT5]|uniref:Zn(2)-C6 fungal-type domain-containing protein n=1 Tax=Plenodomus tracheiphilus IPT5 TaxID=1408161 RepID=A0A6A7AN34_9PLEO|nr:hypothetical protein T440DRAFT_326011 [Plenodomus tracheiphilus IPT5]
MAPKVPIPRLPSSGNSRKLYDEKGQIRNKSRCRKACIDCRNRRIRCTGEQPLCRGCIERKVPCVYLQGHKDQLKETLDQNEQLIVFLKNLSARSVGLEKQKIKELLTSVCSLIACEI